MNAMFNNNQWNHLKLKGNSSTKESKLIYFTYELRNVNDYIDKVFVNEEDLKNELLNFIKEKEI